MICEARGEVQIVGISDAKIPWPVGAVRGGKSPVLYKALVRAVRREAACAVMHWWGVTPWLVNKWRRALGVPRTNDGGRRLMVAIGKSPIMRKSLAAMRAKARDAGRRAMIAAAKRGMPRPKHVLEALRKSHLGKPLSAKTRRNMSVAQISGEEPTRQRLAGRGRRGRISWSASYCRRQPQPEPGERCRP